MRTLRISIPAFALLTLTIIGCGSDADVVPARSYLDNIVMENGILIFGDYNEFDSTTALVANFSEAELNEWEQRKGFVSKRTKIQQAIDELTKVDDAGLEQPKEQLKNYISFDDAGTFLGSAFPLPGRAALVNIDGLVKVGNDLLAFKNDRVVTIIGGDLNKLKEAELLEESNADKSILVARYIQGSQGLHQGRTQATGTTLLCHQYIPGIPGMPRYFQTNCRWTIYKLNNNHPMVQNWYYEVSVSVMNIRVSGPQAPYLALLDLNYQSVRVLFSHLAGGSSPVFSKRITKKGALITELVGSGQINAFLQEVPIATLNATYVNTATDPSTGYVLKCSASNQNYRLYP